MSWFRWKGCIILASIFNGANDLSLYVPPVKSWPSSFGSLVWHQTLITSGKSLRIFADRFVISMARMLRPYQRYCYYFIDISNFSFTDVCLHCYILSTFLSSVNKSQAYTCITRVEFKPTTFAILELCLYFRSVVVTCFHFFYTSVQRQWTLLVFSLGVSQHVHKITNMWKFELNQSS